MHAQTRRQREVFEYITRYVETKGFRPSYQLIARHLGVRSKGGIARLVKALEEQGLLERKRENGHFSLEFPHQTAVQQYGVTLEWLDIPRDGNGEDWEDEPFCLPEFMLGSYSPDRIKAFRVTDNEMAAENIMEEDVALIELRQFVRDSDKVVAVVNRERAVLRKYYRAGAYIELLNSDDDPDTVIRLTADRIEVKGLFRGLIRPL